MKTFNEYALLAAMCSREQDARDLKAVFQPAWLKDVELQPVLSAVYEYMDTQATCPSITSLGQFMQSKDPAKFDSRWKTTLMQLEGFDTPTMTYNVRLAKDVASTYAFSYLHQEQRFQRMLEEGNADGIKAELSQWLAKHTDSDDEGLYSIGEAYDKLVTEHPWQGRSSKIATGIKPIDDWSGGLRAPQFGLIMAPTGQGKSAALMNIARYGAAIEGQTVLFITNELTVNEQTERFLARMQDPKPDRNGDMKFVPLNLIQNDPGIAYKKLEGYQKELDKHLYIYSANLGQDANGVEEIMKRVRNERGVWPNLVVIDYLERMSTSVKMDRGASWTYYGQIAKELVGLSKRRGCAMWSAIQTNRSGMNSANAMSMEQGQGSIMHFQEASLAVGMRKVVIREGEDTKTGLEFTELKARHGAMEGRTMIVEADLGRMYISDNELENCIGLDDDDVDVKTPATGGNRKIQGQAQVKGKTWKK